MVKGVRKIKVIEWIKKEIVLCISLVLAVISMFFVPPNKEYLNYIDTRTLILLFCLMAVVAGWKKAGVLERAAGMLLGRISNTRQLVQALVILCFFSSMFITNDVALLTFVPFGLFVLKKAECRDLTIPVVILQTVAANLGSMLLPVGNPQNLYLYGQSGLGFIQFVAHMFPLWLVSLLTIGAGTMLLKKETVSVNTEPVSVTDGWFYLVLFCLCLGSVANLLPCWLLLPVLVLAILWKDKGILGQLDYCLLATFVCFFVFIGNVKAMPWLAQLLQQWIVGREVAAGILASQIISNVPAAILLSGFTDNSKMLLWGTNIGGLGTLIASLASLISYKIYMQEQESQGGAYCKIFTLVNLVFLALRWYITFLLVAL